MSYKVTFLTSRQISGKVTYLGKTFNGRSPAYQYYRPNGMFEQFFLFDDLDTSIRFIKDADAAFLKDFILISLTNENEVYSMY